MDAVVAGCDKNGDKPYDFTGAWDPKFGLPASGVSDTAVELAKKSREEHDHRKQDVYYRRLSDIEAFHAKPKRPSEIDVFMTKTERRLPPLGAHEGPDFTTFFERAHTSELDRKDANIAAVVVPSRGVIGTAVAPLTTQPHFRRGVVRKHCDFVPIIIVPNAVSAILQLWNARAFFEQGKYTQPAESYLDVDGTARLNEKPDHLMVTPGSLLPSIDTFNVKFRDFKVVDRAEKVTNWDHVCGCIVTGQKWQLEDWYHGDRTRSDPSVLFSNVCGFMPYFEEDKPPATIDQWKVIRLQLSRKVSRAYTTIQAAQAFWEETFKFMEVHPNFRQYTLPPEEDIEA